jgi:hypothetical protein
MIVGRGLAPVAAGLGIALLPALPALLTPRAAARRAAGIDPMRSRRAH